MQKEDKDLRSGIKKSRSRDPGSEGGGGVVSGAGVETGQAHPMWLPQAGQGCAGQERWIDCRQHHMHLHLHSLASGQSIFRAAKPQAPGPFMDERLSRPPTGVPRLADLLADQTVHGESQVAMRTVAVPSVEGGEGVGQLHLAKVPPSPAWRAIAPSGSSIGAKLYTTYTTAQKSDRMRPWPASTRASVQAAALLHGVHTTLTRSLTFTTTRGGPAPTGTCVLPTRRGASSTLPSCELGACRPRQR